VAAKVDKAKFLANIRDKSPHPILALWDGCFYFYRAITSAPPAHYKGNPVHGVLQALRMICSDIEHLKPRYIATVFDYPAPNFRHHIHPGYKAGLWAAPYEEQIQLHALQQLLKLLGFPVYCLSGVEGDDTLATLTKRAPATLGPCNTLMLTADKDMQVLVSNKVRTLDTRSNRFFLGTPATVKEAFGVAPDLISDYLALVGDANDCVPGVPGCGPKKAQQLLKEYGSVPEIAAKAVDRITRGDKTKNLLGTLLPTKPAVRDLLFAYSLTLLKSDLTLPTPLRFAVEPQVSADTINRMWEASFGDASKPSYVDSLIQRQSLKSSGSLFDGDTSHNEELEAEFEMLGNLFAGYAGAANHD
jgi:DNA polymerase-1